MDFTQVILQVVILFVIMFLGLFLRAKKIITEEGIKNYSALIFHVTMPAMIIASTGKIGNVDHALIGQVVIASLFCYLFYVGMAFVLPKLFKAPASSKGLYRFMTIFANVGFIGFPMLSVFLGDGAIFIGSVHNIPFNFILYTFGVHFIVSDTRPDHKMTFKWSQVINSGIICTFIALGVIISKTALPTLVLDIAGMLGGLTTPLAMLVVGASLYGVAIKGLITNARVIGFSLVRMLLFPMVVGFALKLAGIDPMVVSVSVILAAMPIGTNTVIVARHYGGNVLEASEAVFISTVLMIVTTPFLVLLMNML